MQSKEIEYSQQQHCVQPGPRHKHPAGCPVYPRMGINSLHCQVSPWQPGIVTCSFLGIGGTLFSFHILMSLDRPLMLSFAGTEQGATPAPLQGLSEWISLIRGTGRYFGMMSCCRDASEETVSMALHPLPSMQILP